MSAVESIYISKTYKEIRNEYLLLFVLFLVWPFGSFLYALYRYNEIESKVVFILFTALFGYSLVAESSGLDLYRMMQSFPVISHLSFREFYEIHANSDSAVDLYQDTITFLMSRLTRNPKWLLCVLGAISGYVYTKVLSLFISEQPGRNIYKFLLIFSFSFIVGIDQLSGVRMSLAAYVFFYGAIKVIVYGDKNYLIVAASSILIHFSFLSVVILLLFFPKIKNYPRIIYLTLMLSFFLPDFIKSYILQFSGIFGNAIESRTELYYNLTDDLRLGSDTSWYVKYRILSMLVFCYLFFLITVIKKKVIKISNRAKDLFFFSLILLSFVNLTMNIPHFGYRFQYIFLMFAFFYIYKVYIENSESLLLPRLVLISLPFSLLMIVFSIRSTLFITPLSFYYYNLPGLFFDHSIHSAWTTIFK